MQLLGGAPTGAALKPRVCRALLVTVFAGEGEAPRPRRDGGSQRPARIRFNYLLRLAARRTGAQLGYYHTRGNSPTRPRLAQQLGLGKAVHGWASGWPRSPWRGASSARAAI